MDIEDCSLELPAPSGWKKELMRKKSTSRTPRKGVIVFTAPDGEKITSKRKLEQYLKAHPGGPAASEFDWGTGETPRRSTRISGKAKAASPLESEPPKKRSREPSTSMKEKKEAETAPEGDERTEETQRQEAGETEKDAAEAKAGKEDLEEDDGGSSKDAEVGHGIDKSNKCEAGKGDMEADFKGTSNISGAPEKESECLESEKGIEKNTSDISEVPRNEKESIEADKCEEKSSGILEKEKESTHGEKGDEKNIPDISVVPEQEKESMDGDRKSEERNEQPSVETIIENASREQHEAITASSEEKNEDGKEKHKSSFSESEEEHKKTVDGQNEMLNCTGSD